MLRHTHRYFQRKIKFIAYFRCVRRWSGRRVATLRRQLQSLPTTSRDRCQPTNKINCRQHTDTHTHGYAAAYYLHIKRVKNNSGQKLCLALSKFVALYHPRSNDRTLNNSRWINIEIQSNATLENINFLTWSRSQSSTAAAAAAMIAMRLRNTAYLLFLHGCMITTTRQYRYFKIFHMKIYWVQFCVRAQNSIGVKKVC